MKVSRNQQKAWESIDKSIRKHGEAHLLFFLIKEMFIYCFLSQTFR